MRILSVRYLIINMRYFRILALHMEHILEHRSRSFVYFISSVFNPLLMLLFWRGALNGTEHGVTLSSITSYYFLLVIAGSLLTSHIEEGVAEIDIQEGKLSQYIIRPYSYYALKTCEELPYRILQGGYGLLTCLIFVFMFGNFLVIENNPLDIFLAVIIAVLAFFMSFTYKMIIGFVAFWTTDTGGFFQLMEITTIIFAGYLMPFELMPSYIAKISFSMPFSYMIYFPVTAFQGKYNATALTNIIGVQIVWLLLLYALYRWMWKSGMKKFTAIGQ